MFDKTDAHWGQYDFLQTIERVTTFYYLVGQVWIPRNNHNVLHSRGRPRHKEIPRGLLLWRVFGEEPLPFRQNSHSSVLLPQSPVLRHCQTSVSTGTGYKKHSHYSKAMLDKNLIHVHPMEYTKVYTLKPRYLELDWTGTKTLRYQIIWDISVGDIEVKLY